ncbi:uncharacterized protein TNCV_292931 [Trichonephila clavipes]|nr:uncharacterized protein TNCV_292931 [Trichonephila clavipes]
MRAQRYVHDILQPHVLPLMQRLPEVIFQQDNVRPHISRVVTRLSPHCNYPSWACAIPIFVPNRAYLGSFEKTSWASREFKRTMGKLTANLERNVLGHHTERVCFNADRIASCIRATGGSTGYYIFHFFGPWYTYCSLKINSQIVF